MVLDDDDGPAVPAAAQASEDGPAAEDLLEEEVQDFRHFSSLSTKKGFSSQTIRKGEKDFEAHGTRAQSDALEQSRQAMEEVLGHTRVHRPNHWCRGWYFPDAWADHHEETGELGDMDGPGRNSRDGEDGNRPELKRAVHPQDRVVAVEMESGKMFASAGRHIPNAKKSQPGWNNIWLLPEEALFLVERGSLDLWWPTRPLAEILPASVGEPLKSLEEEGETRPRQPGTAGPDDYDLGLPLSFQAAYSLLVGREGERGKVAPEKYLVYSNLRRHGYVVLRAPLVPQPHPTTSSQLAKSHGDLWQWLFSLISNSWVKSAKPPLPHGPLVRPGFYRSYKPIFDQLSIIPRHKPAVAPQHRPEAEEGPEAGQQPQDPFRIHFHVWKATGETFSKTRPRAPDFYMAVVDAWAAPVPTLDQISPLLESSPWDPPKERWQGPSHLYPRLKYGYRNVVLASVDGGLVNYLRFGEAAFGEEPIWDRFDSNVAHRGGKRGGRMGRGGRGRGSGRGRGRGRG